MPCACTRLYAFLLFRVDVDMQAIWMLPTSNQYGGWPASGEIDIMESRGNPASYTAGGVNAFGSTLHFGMHWLAVGVGTVQLH